MTDASEQPIGAAEPGSPSAPDGAAPACPVRVAWVAGPRTLEAYGRILQPAAVGLLDELVGLTLICPERPETAALPSPPMRIVRYGRLSRWAFWETAPKLDDLAEVLRAGRIDLLHALDAAAAPLAARLSRRTGIGYLLSSYDRRDARSLSRSGALKGVLAASAAVLKELRRRRVAGPSQLHLLRPGVYQVRRATCFTNPQYSVTLVVGGPLDDLPAYQAVLTSFAELRADTCECTCFLVGAGRAERQLRAMSEKLQLRHDLTFADWPPQALLPEVFQAADVYISPTVGAAVDVPCLLAMAAGVPVLASGEGASDFLRDGQTALLFRRGNAADLTAKLTALLEDRPRARALADRALEHLREHHRPAAMVAELARIYRQAAEGGQGRARAAG